MIFFPLSLNRGSWKQPNYFSKVSVRSVHTTLPQTTLVVLRWVCCCCSNNNDTPNLNFDVSSLYLEYICMYPSTIYAAGSVNYTGLQPIWCFKYINFPTSIQQNCRSCAV